MPAITTLVSAWSVELVSQLDAAGLPALTDGKILIGKQHIFEQSTAPRVVFVPMTSEFKPPTITSSYTAATAAERKLEYQQRAIRTETVHFEVHVWGQSSAKDPDLDWDATQALYQRVMVAVYLTAVGVAHFANGYWTDSTKDGTAIMNAGREFVFRMSVDTPVVDVVLQVQPAGTTAVTSTSLAPNDGTATGVGCNTP